MVTTRSSVCKGRKVLEVVRPGVISGAILAGVCAGFVPLRAHDPVNSTVTWNGDIRRLLQARCAACHVTGGRGPMPLTTYEEARPWARAIREEVLARRMPKWHAARGYGQFANDRSLTPFEIALIVAWVDGGAKKGDAQTAVREAFRPAVREAFRPATLTLACGDRPLPKGRLLAVKPQLEEGDSAGINVLLPDGRREPIAWIRGFERKFTETYWLRDPVELPDGARLQVEARGRCRVDVTLSTPNSQLPTPKT